MLTVEELRGHLEGYSLVKAIDVVRGKHLRLRTEFLYPDGDVVDVFLLEAQPLGGFILSDLGQTISWLSDTKRALSKSEGGKYLIEETIAAYNVGRVNGTLMLTLSSLDDLPDNITQLCKACTEVAKLENTQFLDEN